MAIPGLLVEYLISGALALVWLAPLLKRVELDVTQANVLPLLVLWLYVVGMVVDFLAFWLVKPIKPMVRRRALRKLGLPDPRLKVQTSVAWTSLCTLPSLPRKWQ
jgi:hypothetical protein